MWRELVGPASDDITVAGPGSGAGEARGSVDANATFHFNSPIGGNRAISAGRARSANATFRGNGGICGYAAYPGICYQSAIRAYSSFTPRTGAESMDHP
jgi:hypothetical protein